MPDIIKISELDEALALADAAEFPYYQDNGGQNTTYKAPMTQIGAKIVEGLTYQGINLPAGAGNKTVENSLNYLLNAVGGDPNGNISDSYDPTAAYVKGDLCIYENVLYICTAPTTGTFDPSKWTATTIDNVIGSLSQLTTTDKSSLVGAVKEVNEKATSFIYTDSTVTNFIDLFASIPNNKTIGFLMNSGTVSNCPVPYPMGIIAKWNSSTAFIVLTQLNGTDATYIGRIISGALTWRKITTPA